MTLPIILDTQLIVLLAVGETSPTLIRKHKNLAAYDEDAYQLLLLLLGVDHRLLLLPNIVSEASKLLRQHRDPERRRIMSTFADLIRRHPETYVMSSVASAHPAYGRLGVTDAAILTLSTSDTTILTADLELYLAAKSLDLPAMNFNHERENFGL